MSESIIDASRDFFTEVVRPILENEFPTETAQTAFGVFGYGSEVIGLDDTYSTDHHWGLRINALIPEALYKTRNEAIQAEVSARLPTTWRGHTLREGLSGGRGLSLTSLEGYLRRTVGIDHPPATYAEWLSLPEEDIIHVVEGELWHDPSGQFTAVRNALKQYYPEPVRRRRIAHWSRYYSGMGAYALKRALLRHNEYYANITFTRAIRLGVQLAFLLDKRYFPYDKWTLAYFERLPRMAARLGPSVDEAVRLATPWERKLELLDHMSDILDATMVEDGLLQPHPKFTGSPTSGYRLMERAYAEIIQGLPNEIKTVVPVWDQIYMEQFHAGYVNSLDLRTWENLLNLTRADEAA